MKTEEKIDAVTSLNTLLRSHEPCDWLDKVQDAFCDLNGENSRYRVALEKIDRDYPTYNVGDVAREALRGSK